MLIEDYVHGAAGIALTGLGGAVLLVLLGRWLFQPRVENGAGEPGLPVSDPFGASREAYEECWRRIRRHVKRLVPSVREALRTRSM